jgi:hypothetical protein
VQPHRFELWLHSPDPLFREKVSEICQFAASWGQPFAGSWGQGDGLNDQGGGCPETGFASTDEISLPKKALRESFAGSWGQRVTPRERPARRDRRTFISPTAPLARSWMELGLHRG